MTTTEIPKPYYHNEALGITIYNGKCEDVVGALTVGAVVTDPPYGLSFMGKQWDYDVPSVDQWKRILCAVKPGGYLLAFAGTRTQHRMAVNIEDAGFEIRDMIAWMYGQGMPKAYDIGKGMDKAAGAKRTEVVGRYQPPGMDKPWNLTKAKDDRTVEVFASSRNNLDILAPVTDEAKRWEGWATALKPAMEPITVAMRPRIGTIVENVLAHGVGAMNIDGCRVPCEPGANLDGGRVSTRTDGRDRPWKHDEDAVKACRERGAAAVAKAEEKGRWPANVVHDGSDEVLEAFPDAPGQLARAKSDGTKQNNKVFGQFTHNTQNPEPRGDSGSAARFFYCAKASSKERGEGNDHPTVKPVALMRYLVRLVTPPGEIVLDPFMGSGTTALAAIHENRPFIGIEMDEKHCATAVRRIEALAKELGKEPGIFS